MTLTTAVTGWLNHRKAADEIHDLSRRSAVIQRHLSHPMSPLDRAEQIEDLAWVEEQIAAAYATTGRTDDLAQVTASGARLTEIIADSQYALAEGWPEGDPAPESTECREGWTPEQSAVFRALCVTADPMARAELIEGPFLDAWADEARAEAGECVLAVAYAERKSARPGRRAWRPRQPLPRWAAAVLWLTRVILSAALALASAALWEGAFGTSWWQRGFALITALTVFWWAAPEGKRKGAPDA